MLFCCRDRSELQFFTCELQLVLTPWYGEGYVYLTTPRNGIDDFAD
jgi:hypothetical protein